MNFSITKFNINKPIVTFRSKKIFIKEIKCMYGLLGEKLGHSFSKEIHESINDYKYDLIEVSKDDFDSFKP